MSSSRSKISLTTPNIHTHTHILRPLRDRVATGEESSRLSVTAAERASLLNSLAAAELASSLVSFSLLSEPSSFKLWLFGNNRLLIVPPHRFVFFVILCLAFADLAQRRPTHRLRRRGFRFQVRRGASSKHAFSPLQRAPDRGALIHTHTLSLSPSLCLCCYILQANTRAPSQTLSEQLQNLVPFLLAPLSPVSAQTRYAAKSSTDLAPNRLRHVHHAPLLALVRSPTHRPRPSQTTRKLPGRRVRRRGGVAGTPTRGLSARAAAAATALARLRPGRRTALRAVRVRRHNRRDFGVFIAPEPAGSPRPRRLLEHGTVLPPWRHPHRPRSTALHAAMGP
jgi:hypothetical protein